MYYLSWVLTDVEARYPHAERIALTLIYSVRKLRLNFQAHLIIILTDQPLKSISQKPETSGQLVKADNRKTDRLARDAAVGSPEQYAREPQETLAVPSIDSLDQEVLQIDEGNNWMTPYRKYLTDKTLSENTDKAEWIKKIGGWFAILDKRLYKRGYFTPSLKRLTPEEAEYALSEVHLGICDSHIRGKNLAFKIV
ncbi:hypothetical protein Nepgr_017523 [Nepenthes gracilis]|uniref:Reverse transcriptase RNase H-like domain-containing protein n=1 Tax=Nepenthes gracilis TaxID=150966 RepID=A0AAD3SR91_NEPGR|nr:hypothetical protein Nepgr_017523 [Nepenthes gracilis]